MVKDVRVGKKHQPAHAADEAVETNMIPEFADERAGQKGPNEPKPVLVLKKARAILDTFAERSPELTFSEIVVETGLPVTTCHRLLHTLVAEGFLSRRDSRYSPGPKILAWAQAGMQGQSMDITQNATTELDALRDATGETAGLYVRDGLHRSLVALSETKHPVIRIVRLGEVQALHTGSAGKVILAHDPELVEQVLSSGLEGATATTKTVRDAGVLRAELEAVRRQGYATSFEERELGTGSISAPVFNSSDHVIATIGIIGPIQRINADTVSKWIPAVLAAAARLSALRAGTD